MNKNFLCLEPDRIGKDGFLRSLKADLADWVAHGRVPLEQATTQGGLVDPASTSVTVIGVTEEAVAIKVRFGVFFEEVVGGCSCGDEPHRVNGYGELIAVVDRRGDEVRFEPISD